MPTHTFESLVLSHEGKRFAVCGGSPHLADDLDAVNADVYISANEHGIKLRPCDYVVSMDDLHGSGKEMPRVLKQYLGDALILSPCGYADARLHSWPNAPRRLYSGLVGAWVAYALGAKVVFLCGFDAYQQKTGAIRKAKMFVDGIKCEVREVGGRMGVWPEYRKGERFRYKRHPELETLRGDSGKTTVRAFKATTLPSSGPIAAGDTAVVYRDDKIIRRLLHHGILREVRV